jgi:hypothetical protein
VELILFAEAKNPHIHQYDLHIPNERGVFDIVAMLILVGVIQ